MVRGMIRKLFGVIFIVFIVALLAGAWFFGVLSGRNHDFWTWRNGSNIDRTQLVTVQREACADAPFVLPADGFVGLLYADPRLPYNQARPHQGIDIFVDEIGVVPVYAAADGYITRESDWISTLIQRVDNPLNPGETIWLYYTHMADEDGNDFIEDVFPAGTRNVFVEQGTLLGYIGNYDGNKPSRIWPHLHFSVVRSDGTGVYLDEAIFDNTNDPSPYLGMGVMYGSADEPPIGCKERT